MTRRARVAINWAGACGGCDVSLLDTEERLLDLVAEADVVPQPPEVAVTSPKITDVSLTPTPSTILKQKTAIP